VEILVSNTDILDVPADLIVLKHADQFYGADRAVANAVGFTAFVKAGDFVFCEGKGLAARMVLFIGVGPLRDFRYERIQDFGSKAIKLARQHHGEIRHLALTIHGPGYGLDPEQSFLSMVAGIISEWRRSEQPLQRITIAERSEKRCEQLNAILHEHLREFGLQQSGQRVAVNPATTAPSVNSAAEIKSNIVQFGVRAEEKPRLFVAMPFSNDFIDEFEIGFHEAAKASAFVCERLDLEAFTGDIVAEIRNRIVGSHGVIALLNGHNPNVFLEIGFAWAHGKPTILVAKEDVKLPFDVSAHRCIRYKNIVQLRDLLTSEIARLKAQGIFARTA
jgi:hypothetical protein